MALGPIINSADMVEFGFSCVDPGVFNRVSARIRRHTGQAITAQESTASGRSPLVLPQYPVTSVTSVTTRAGTALTADSYQLNGSILTGPVCLGLNDFEINLGQDARNYGWLTVVYQSGWDAIPDELRELACSIAARIAATSDASAAGIESRKVGEEAITFSSAALTGGLTDDEKNSLDDIFPPHLRRGPRTVVLTA